MDFPPAESPHDNTVLKFCELK